MFAKTIAVALAGLLGLVGLALFGVEPPLLQPQQTKSELTQAPRVASFAALAARTPGELKRAEFFDYGYVPLATLGETSLSMTSEAPELPPPPMPFGFPEPKPLTAEEKLALKVCQRQIVVIGHPESAKVLINKEGTWLFTDYVVGVERPFHPKQVSQQLIVSIPSGSAVVGGKTVSTKTVPLLELGQSYVFFLDRIETSDGFLGTNEHVDLRSGTIRSGSATVARDATKYVAALASAGQNCGK